MSVERKTFDQCYMICKESIAAEKQRNESAFQESAQSQTLGSNLVHHEKARLMLEGSPMGFDVHDDVMFGLMLSVLSGFAWLHCGKGNYETAEEYYKQVQQ